MEEEEIEDEEGEKIEDQQVEKLDDSIDDVHYDIRV